LAWISPVRNMVISSRLISVNKYVQREISMGQVYSKIIIHQIKLRCSQAAKASWEGREVADIFEAINCRLPEKQKS
jgi:hypothetical protein